MPALSSAAGIMPAATMSATAARSPKTGAAHLVSTPHLPSRRRTRHVTNATVMRGIAMDGRAVMVDRRRGRRTSIRVDDVLDHHRLFGRFDAGTVAMGADCRTVGVLDDTHAIADRAKRSVNVIAIHPGSSGHAASRQGQHRGRHNRLDVPVHDPPAFLLLHQGRRSIRRKLTRKVLHVDISSCSHFQLIAHAELCIDQDYRADKIGKLEHAVIARFNILSKRHLAPNRFSKSSLQEIGHT